MKNGKILKAGTWGLKKGSLKTIKGLMANIMSDIEARVMVKKTAATGQTGSDSPQWIRIEARLLQELLLITRDTSEKIDDFLIANQIDGDDLRRFWLAACRHPTLDECARIKAIGIEGAMYVWDRERIVDYDIVKSGDELYFKALMDKRAQSYGPKKKIFFTSSPLITGSSKPPGGFLMAAGGSNGPAFRTTGYKNWFTHIDDQDDPQK